MIAFFCFCTKLEWQRSMENRSWDMFVVTVPCSIFSGTIYHFVVINCYSRHTYSIMEFIVWMFASFRISPKNSSRHRHCHSVVIHLGFALIASSLQTAAHLCAIVHALPVCRPDYVSSCVSERAVRLKASAASFMSVCHPVPGLQ